MNLKEKKQDINIMYGGTTAFYYDDVKNEVLAFEKMIQKHISHCKKYKDVEREEDFKSLAYQFKEKFGDFNK